MEVLKFNNRLYSPRTEGVKLYFSAGELRKKPIKFWVNCGSIPKYSRLQKIRKVIRKILEVKSDNGIDHLAYYGGGRVLFPFQITWSKNENHYKEKNKFKFEFYLWDSFGQNAILKITRTCNSMDRFTNEDVESMKNAMELHYHLVGSGYNFAKKINSESKNYSDVFKSFNKISALQSEKAELMEFIQWAIDNNVMSVVGDDKAEQLLTKIK